jgi:hypothetical protein
MKTVAEGLDFESVIDGDVKANVISFLLAEGVLATGRRKDFAGIGGLTLVSPRMISPGRSASDILNGLGR